MRRSRASALQATGLLVVLLIAVVALLPLLGGPALLLPAAGWVALAMAAFILLQLLLFRLFGLRSQADEESPARDEGDGLSSESLDAAPPTDAAESSSTTATSSAEQDRDWRAWRG